MRTGRRDRLTRMLAELGFTGAGERDWRERAACATADPELFYPLDIRTGAGPARRVCAECPVRELCLADVLASEDPALRWGVIGGLTPPERSELFARQRQAVA